MPKGIYKRNINGTKNPFYGKHHTKESKEKMSIRHKQYFKTHNGTMKNKIFSEKHRKKLSMSHIGIQIKEKHPNWKGGEIKKICKICNKIFYVRQYRKDIALYCSRKCQSKAFSMIPPEKHPNWKGGKQFDSRGYILIHSFNHPYKDSRNYVRRSRLIMEKHLNRYLSPKEVVHHINGIKIDDRIENLWLFSSNSEHQKFHQYLNHKP